MFSSLGERAKPTKSALSQIRQNVSYEYFRDAFSNLQRGLEVRRQKFLGLHIYAIDGQQLTLPRSADVIERGFNGRAVSKYRESYYPKGFLTHAYDVINGVTKGFTFEPTLNEPADARQLIKNFETDSLTIYDRLYYSQKMAEAHFEHGSYFLFRARINCHPTVKKLLSSKKKIMTGMVGGKRVHFIKIKNYESKEDMVFITNLPKRLISRTLISQLYRARWEVETSFKELTAITKAEQWHSKSYNGIMQELFAIFWLINATKGIMKKCGDFPVNPQKRHYKKANFKLIFNVLADRLAQLWYQFRGLMDDIKKLVKESTESRKKCSRKYKRKLKGAASPYGYENTEWNWDKASSLN